MYQRGISTGVNKTNRAMLAGQCDFGNLAPDLQEMMLDPQTSGGLLVSLPEAHANQALQALNDSGVSTACIIGDVSDPAGDQRLCFS